MNTRQPEKKLTIVGGGIIGVMEAYIAFQEARSKNERIRITIVEKNAEDVHYSTSTATGIFPSFTFDEIVSVVPRGNLLREKLGIKFSEPGGIRVDDVPGIKGEAGDRFIAAVIEDSKDEAIHEARLRTLLELGKLSMGLWRSIFEAGDVELKQIMRDSNYNPCAAQQEGAEPVLHKGHRVDLIYDVPDAFKRADGMRMEYQKLGFPNCKILSPDEVKKVDPSLTDFCHMHSTVNAADQRVWNSDTTALYRPGGCINTAIFLPKFVAYLTKIMGTYVDEHDASKVHTCFNMRFGKKVQAVTYEAGANRIAGLQFFQGPEKSNKKKYADSRYVFNTGEAVGTLHKLGFQEPAYAGFAGASLMLTIPVPPERVEEFSNVDHCMEVHREGVVLAWQAKFQQHETLGPIMFVGVAGTKAFYADQVPHKDQEFATNRNHLQLNMVNDVLPRVISLAFGRDTTGKSLSMDDLRHLERLEIARRWVGTRAVAYDGFPTIGDLYNEHGKVEGARCTTHLGSGGVSFAPAAVLASQGVDRFVVEGCESNDLLEQVRGMGRSNRG